MFSNSCPYIFKLRKSGLFRKEAKPTKSKRRPLAAKCKSRVLPIWCAVSYVRFAHSVGAQMQKKIPFGIYLSILLGKLRKSLLFRKEAKPTKSKRRLKAVFLQKSCFADMVRRILRSLRSLRSASNAKKNPFRDFVFAFSYYRNFVHFAYSVRLPMQKKIPFGILFLHMVRRQGFEPGTH